jgi:anti-sigma regulatory factor (Ser/Thr protein kinase)
VQLDRLDWLAQNLLELSKLDSSLVLLDLRPDDVRGTIESAVEQQQAAAERKGIRMTTDLPERPLRIRHDPPRVGQIVSNLVGNAVKFTERDGSIAVSATAEPAGGARIEVADTGAGIDAAELPQIFDPVHRGSNANEARGRSGLGLAIVKSIVDMHHGTIEVESRVGYRSRFVGPAATRPARGRAGAGRGRRRCGIAKVDDSSPVKTAMNRSGTMIAAPGTADGVTGSQPERRSRSHERRPRGGRSQGAGDPDPLDDYPAVDVPRFAPTPDPRPDARWAWAPTSETANPSPWQNPATATPAATGGYPAGAAYAAGVRRPPRALGSTGSAGDPAAPASPAWAPPAPVTGPSPKSGRRGGAGIATIVTVSALSAVLASGGTVFVLDQAAPSTDPRPRPRSPRAADRLPAAVTIDESSAIIDAAAKVGPAVVKIDTQGRARIRSPGRRASARA